MPGTAPPGTTVDAWPALLDLARETDPGRLASGLDALGSAELVDRYARLLLAGPDAVVAQLGQSLDGCVATRSGDACFVTGEADREHLHRLRALVDAVVVGPGTVAADDPQLTVRAVVGPHPVRVVLDPRGTLAGARLLREPDVLWLRGGTGAPASPGAEVVRLPPEGFAPRAIRRLLAARGLGRVLVEGGGRTVSAWIDAGQVDLLFLTVAPFVIGAGGRRGLALADVEPLAAVPRPPVRRHLLGADVCFELDLRRR
ncbi:RibD family protein [Kineococcus gynurae]|uniref:RibD family protein n=1 Tax=Kineococcus gynurae TaxID=452979 RepID=A0ABV5LUX8_9ACTN